MNKKVFIIAEICKNFIQTKKNQSVKTYLTNAVNLVNAAKRAGVDAVKFQVHDFEDEQLNIKKVRSPHFKSTDRYYWVKRITKATPLSAFWQSIKRYCNSVGIAFFATPMSKKGAQLLEKLDVKLWKISSGDILDFVMLDYIALTKKPIIISSGMSTLEELDEAIKFLKKRGAVFTLLHCVSRYPCPPQDLNLASIKFLKKRYGVPVGFSDHSLNIESALVAVSLGACVIEKHLTLNRNFWGPDHKASLLPRELKRLVDSIRKLEKGIVKIDKKTRSKYLGKANKILQEKEAVFRPYFRKSLMAGKNLQAETVLKPNMIYAMRPQAFAKGLPSENYEKVLGKRIIRNVKKYDPITWDLF